MQYPATPNPSYSIMLIAKWKTVVSQMDSGIEQRRQKQVQDLYDATLTYTRLTLVDMGTLWDFYQSCRGSLISFYLYDLEANRRIWQMVYAGIGDAATLIFDLPGKNTSEQSIYLNGALQGGGYTILTGGGNESSDRVEFTYAPPAGTIITATFMGDFRIKCRFKDDSLTRENFFYILFKTGLDLVGLPV
jgi:hypothetical protein